MTEVLVWCFIQIDDDSETLSVHRQDRIKHNMDVQERPLPCTTTNTPFTLPN
ncbi:MAG: hypothetical protein P8179_03845 [Candidatus Thiodiazotropha sp.]